jgi:hypothetical protein
MANQYRTFPLRLFNAILHAERTPDERSVRERSHPTTLGFVFENSFGRRVEYTVSFDTESATKEME